MTAPESEATRPAIHEWFGLSYSNYLVLHRTLLQSMPEVWQQDFVAMVEQLNDAFAHVEQPEAYLVQPAVSRVLVDLSDEELARIGYTATEDDCDCSATRDPETGTTVFVPATCPHETSYHDERGQEFGGGQRVTVPVGDDPIPHYSRGRTYIEPRLKADA